MQIQAFNEDSKNIMELTTVGEDESADMQVKEVIK